MESSVGPMQKLVEAHASDAPKLAALRAEFEAQAALYWRRNLVHQHYLLTRAIAR